MRKLVVVVLCALAVLPASAVATPGTKGLLGRAARLSGFVPRRAVATVVVSSKRYEVLLQRALERDYPSSLRQLDARLYTRLGLLTRSVRARQVSDAFTSNAWYDARQRKLIVRTRPAPGRASVINELVRALVDQNFGLRRTAALRSRDRDHALAAQGIVDGTASLASGLRARRLQGTPFDRFLQLEQSVGRGPGRALAAQLRYLGGRRALASALRSFPQTTEQLLHIDKFLERERALPVRLTAQIGDATLSGSESFGELDARSMLSAFNLSRATAAAAGWGGARIALYTSPAGGDVAVIVARWDTFADAAEWQDAIARYIAAAFPGAAQHDCPPLDRCWSGPAEVASGSLGDATVFAVGTGADRIAALLLHQ